MNQKTHEVDENVNKTAHGQICKLYANSYVNSRVSKDDISSHWTGTTNM